VLSTAWFRANLDRYKDAAIDSPTPDNVERYLVLQRLMMDRASRFTDMFQRVVASTPYLDANTERPLDSVAANATNEIAASATDALLRTLAGSVGLVFFFRSDCAICATQVEILQAATHLYGFTVLYVSLDGKPMTDMAMPAWQMPAWTANAGQAERMGITSAPALAVMRPPSQFGLLAKTVLSLPTLSERVLLQARAAGWISEDDYAATRPVKDHPLQVAADAVSDATVADAEKFLAFIHGLKEAQP
jgi:conjugal transfer pilus assembly protein TraF